MDEETSAQQTKGRILVTIQFVLLGWLILLPTTLGSWGAASDPMLAIGLALMVLAVVLVTAGFLALSSTLSVMPTPRQNGQLKTNGIFKLVRHPIYSGLMCVALGLICIDGFATAGLPSLLLFIVLNVKARFEEKLLGQKYPDYSQYMQRVGRFFPRLFR